MFEYEMFGGRKEEIVGERDYFISSPLFIITFQGGPQNCPQAALGGRGVNIPIVS